MTDWNALINGLEPKAVVYGNLKQDELFERIKSANLKNTKKGIEKGVTAIFGVFLALVGLSVAFIDPSKKDD